MQIVFTHVVSFTTPYLNKLLYYTHHLLIFRRCNLHNSMRYYEENIDSSEKVYDILALISNREDGDYAKGISDKLELDRSVVSEIISSLVDLNIIQKGKRTRAQYYEIREDKIYEFFLKLWLKEVAGVKENPTTYAEFNKLAFSKDLSEKYSNFPDDQLEDLVRNYALRYLKTVDDSTLRAMLVEDFVNVGFMSKIKGNISMPLNDFYHTIKDNTDIIDQIQKPYNNYVRYTHELLDEGININEAAIIRQNDEFRLKCERCNKDFDIKAIEKVPISFGDPVNLECDCRKLKKEYNDLLGIIKRNS